MASYRHFARAFGSRALLVGVLFGSVAWAPKASASEPAPTASEKAKAKRSLERGQKLYAAGKLDEALAAFQASHDAVADPKASLMMARVKRDNGELLQARETYQAALDEAQAAEARGQARRATMDEIKHDLRELDGVLGFVTVELVHAPPGTQVTIDGHDVTGQLGAPIRVAPGPLVVVATAPGGVEKSQKATVKAGQTASVELSFTWSGKSDESLAEVPPDSDAHPDHSDAESEGKSPAHGKKTLAWVAGGVGLAGVATFAVFGAMSSAKFNHLQDACPDGHCPPDLESDKNAGQTFQTIANVGLIVGVVGAGAAVTLFALGGPSESAYSASATAPKLSVGLGSVQLSGAFQ